MKKDSDGARGK